MSSLFACSVQGFMFLKDLNPRLLMLKINQFHLLVVLFLGLFFPLLPFRPVSTKPYGSWEKERNELYFQILTKGAVVSKRPMNAWDTVVYRRASSRHWGPKGRLMELPLLKQRNTECFCHSCRPPSSTPSLTTSLPSLLGAKIPLAVLMTYGWRKKCVAGQERHKVSILSIKFWYLYHKKQESQQRLCSSRFERAQNAPQRTAHETQWLVSLRLNSSVLEY